MMPSQDIPELASDAIAEAYRQQYTGAWNLSFTTSQDSAAEPRLLMLGVLRIQPECDERPETDRHRPVFGLALRHSDGSPHSPEMTCIVNQRPKNDSEFPVTYSFRGAYWYFDLATMCAVIERVKWIDHGSIVPVSIMIPLGLKSFRRSNSMQIGPAGDCFTVNLTLSASKCGS